MSPIMSALYIVGTVSILYSIYFDFHLTLEHVPRIIYGCVLMFWGILSITSARKLLKNIENVEMQRRERERKMLDELRREFFAKIKDLDDI